MIEPGTSKSGGVMAQRTIFACGKVAATLDGRYCSRAIVAGCTVIYDTAMIEYRVCKGAGYVTDRAILVCQNMAAILHGAHRRTRRIVSVT